MTINAEERPEDALRRLIAEISDILRSANAAPGMPDPDESITAALRWLVDDWRIERSANELDRERNLAGADDPGVDAEGLARLFHETYEQLAPSMGYETRKASAKPWAEVPETNRTLMVAVAAHILTVYGGTWKR